MSGTTDTAANGKFVRIQAVNPATVCHPEALLACALLSVGVAEHPRFRFTVSEEEINGQSVTVWRWLFQPQSGDGQYQTAQLVKWWNDAAWLAANPVHEWAILRNGLMNMGEIARRVRETVPRLILRRGKLSAHIPANASPARRQFLLDKLEGRIQLNAPFTEPAVPAAA